MRHYLLSSSLSTTTTMPAPPSSTTATRKPPSNPNPSPNPATCSHSPSATLDLLILLLVLFSGAFLLLSYLSYISHSLSLLLPRPSAFSAAFLSSLPRSPISYLLVLILLLLAAILAFEICCGRKSRKCGKIGCKGMKKAMEFDLQLQKEAALRSGAAAVREVDGLPWKGGNEVNPDYECLRAELRKMAPPNGRAVLLFRSRCGCPVAKLEGWGPKRRRRNKK
ncbi:hypothetical protein RJ639_004094 [Escallonia herrerae]|uniref:Ribosomal protein L34e superfamily protein n=1 Tax=Escallonia herrerae TaxID=1293975 RepID=A0AA88W5P8_9ASTE|nr:hypothetical protein RJ639_004094 [Escallonia herrerae]